MDDEALFTLVKGIIDAQLPLYGITGVAVFQGYQKELQGRPVHHRPFCIKSLIIAMATLAAMKCGIPKPSRWI